MPKAALLAAVLFAAPALADTPADALAVLTPPDSPMAAATPDPSPPPLTALALGQCAGGSCAVPPSSTRVSDAGAVQLRQGGRFTGRLREARPVRTFLGRLVGRFRGGCR